MRGSTRSSLFPDVNVWVALTYDGHVHHGRAKLWLDSVQAGTELFFCRVTQLGLLRLLTTEAVMGKQQALSQAGAWQAYDLWLEDDRVSFLAEPSGIDRPFRDSSRLDRPAPKDWADSYLIAFAAVSGLTLVTFDRVLRRRAERSILLT